MHFIYDEFRNALTMDKDSAVGWCSPTLEMVYANSHWDSITDRWYVQFQWTGGGLRRFYGIIEVDVDTWTITNCWNTSSTPAFNIWADSVTAGSYNTTLGAHPYCVVTGDVEGNHVSVLNYETDTIVHYAFDDNYDALFGLPKNVSYTDHNPIQPERFLGYAQVDSTTKRLYLAYKEASNRLSVGWIDLTETVTGDDEYTYNEIVYDASWNNASMDFGMVQVAPGGVQIFPEFDLIVAGARPGSTGAGTHDMEFRTYELSTGNLVKYYKQTTHSTFPNHGVGGKGSVMMYVGGVLFFYSHFTWTNLFTQQDQRGIIKINFATDSWEFIRPTTSTDDEYYIRHLIKIDDDHIAMTATHPTDGGIYIMNVNDESWQKIDNTSAPGLTEDGKNSIGPMLNYDPVRGLFLTGSGVVSHWTGIIAVSQYGPLRKSQYVLGADSGGWSFGSANPLVQEINGYNAVGAIDPVTNGLYAFWTSQNIQDLSIKWDYEQGGVNLDPYISKEHEITVERFIDGTPARLSFTVSHGHLFDKHNINSTLKSILTKFRQITLRFGELSASVSYWKNQGTFIVTETSMHYERGQYPIMSVTCEDKLATWDNHIVITTDDYFDTDPDVAVDTIVKAHTDFTTSTINLPAMNNKENINHQWVETDTLSIVTQIQNRFGYYPRIDVDGKFSAKEIAEDSIVSQTYTDASQIINFSPDDTYSDFTNQVQVTGEEIGYSEVLHAEERIGVIEGTVGWWGRKGDT